MKENKKMGMTRKLSVIALLLCLTLIVGCFLNGTFAKYTTKAEGSDDARVAKWGIELDVNSDVFMPKYASDADYISNAVESDNGDNVIAPGTSGSMSFSIKGNPETALSLKASLGELERASVTSGATEGTKPTATRRGFYATEAFTYRGTAYEAGQFFGQMKPIGPHRDKVKRYEIGEVIEEAPATGGTPGTTYYPVNWKLNKDGIDLANGNLADIETYLTSISGDYAPNSSDFKNVCGEYTLTWNWAFESGSDELDTVLGNAAADIQTDGYVCNLIEKFNFEVSATQID